MKIQINEDVLKKYNLSLGHFIILLTGYFNLDCQKLYDELVLQGLAERDLFKGFPPILSDNTKNMIAKILMESAERVIQSNIDFDKLAIILQSLYPEGIKAGKTYEWRGKTDEIAQKLRTLVAHYGFTFTVKEAIEATREYIQSFQPPYTYMHTLRNFLLYTKKDGDGKYEMESLFMTIIENHRDEEVKSKETNKDSD